MQQNEKIQQLLNELTLEEKISMVHGCTIFQTAPVERLEIPALKMSDGPMGVRQEYPSDSWEPLTFSNDFVSYLPSNLAVAASWSEEAAYKLGKTLGMEARGRGKDVILAPGINIIRSPLGGRSFEYMSEDPFLISKLVVPLIEGIQENDVAACLKHFAANNHEHNRLSISVDMPEQAFQEIYLPGFEAAVKKGKTLTIMSAYNRFRDEFCSENPELLKKILREKWGFDGVVISDWGAVHNTEKAASSGLDIEMHVHANFNEHFLADNYLDEIKKGNLPESDLNEKVENILRLMFRLKMFDSDRKQGSFNSPQARTN
ncbi:MAG: glycoside hydrolase family 3 N-terminal domain-containing protein, partial [Spirochaetales bacterium]|nr:glycoside hydrolase family 3 N-terminal domain-containing protein [Spirochaetales bacterium]